MKKKLTWLDRLNEPVRAHVKARIAADGYGDDADAWVCDALTTAARSPQGLLLRIARKPGSVKEDAAQPDDLFAQKNQAQEGLE